MTIFCIFAKLMIFIYEYVKEIVVRYAAKSS